MLIIIPRESRARCDSLRQTAHAYFPTRSFFKKQMQLNSSSVIMRRQYSIPNDTSQPISICYFSSISPLDPFTQLAGTCWRCLHCRPSLADNAPSYCTPSVWNKLPLSIRSLNSFNSFKSYLKAHLFAHH